MDLTACLGAESLKDASDLGPRSLCLVPPVGGHDLREPHTRANERVQPEGRHPDRISEGNLREVVLSHEVVGGCVFATTRGAIQAEK
jgi:hypothetical protein